MKNAEYVDWNFFWKRVKKHPLFLKFLYFVHLKKYTKILKKIHLITPAVLEIGAGTGAAALHVQDLYGGSVTLVDNSKMAYEMHEPTYEMKAVLEDL